MTLSPTEKLRIKNKKVLLRPLTDSKSKALLNRSLKKLNTYGDLFHYAGIDRKTGQYVYGDAILLAPVTYNQVASFFNTLIYLAESAIDYPYIPSNEKEVQENFYSRHPTNGSAIIASALTEGDSSKLLVERETTTSNKDDASSDEKLIDISKGKLKAKLYPFQDRAALKLFTGLTGLDANNTPTNFTDSVKRGLLLEAEVGIGKTFIIGRLVRQLLDIGWFTDCLSPWPCILVTRVSVVEQTKRVFEFKFGITGEDTHIINIEQLRSEFGRLLVKEIVEVVGGEEQFRWEFRKNIEPKLILLDESQSVKNVRSTQSKIMQAYTETQI